MTTKTKRFGSGTITGEASVVDQAVDELALERARQDAVRERWGEGGVGSGARMTRLCNAFPSLRGAAGTAPWDAMRFLEWLCTSGEVTGGSRRVGKFVLQVWNSAADWQAIARTAKPDGLGLTGVTLEPFNIVADLGGLDSDHMRAIREWVELPFWP